MSIRAPILQHFRRRILNVQRCSTSIRPLLSNRAVALNRSFLPTRSYASISAAELQFGQPLHETHPNLLEPGECMFDLFHLVSSVFGDVHDDLLLFRPKVA